MSLQTQEIIKSNNRKIFLSGTYGMVNIFTPLVFSLVVTEQKCNSIGS